MGEILQAHRLTNWAKAVASKRPKLDLFDYRQQWAQMRTITTSDMNDLALDKPSLVWLTMAPGEKPLPVQHWWLSRRLRDHFTLALQLVPCIVILYCSEDWGIISRSKWPPPQSQHNMVEYKGSSTCYDYMFCGRPIKILALLSTVYDNMDGYKKLTKTIEVNTRTH